MKTLTLEQFLYDLTWSDNVRHKLRVVADRDDVLYLVATADDNGKLTASIHTVKPKAWPANTVAVFCKAKLRETAEVPKSKTMQALALIQEEGLSAYGAAKRLGINPSAVTRALQRREDKTLCPCCGQVVREGYEVNPSVLKSRAAKTASS